MLGSPRLSYVAGEVFAVDGGFQGARYTGRHQAAWADHDHRHLITDT